MTTLATMQARIIQRVAQLIKLYDEGKLEHEVFLWSFRHIAPTCAALTAILQHAGWSDDKKAMIIKGLYETKRRLLGERKLSTPAKVETKETHPDAQTQVASDTCANVVVTMLGTSSALLDSVAPSTKTRDDHIV